MRRSWQMRRPLATACVACVCSHAAGVDVSQFDLTVDDRRAREKIEQSLAVEPIDPGRCGTDRGWIEILKYRAPVNVAGRALESERIKVHRPEGIEVVDVPGIGRGPFDKSNTGTIAIDYQGCVVPSGKVLLSFGALIDVETKDGPQGFAVTYDGPPKPLGSRLYRSDLMEFRVRTDLGEAVVTEAMFSWWNAVVQHYSYTLSLRLQSKGATE